MTLPPLNGPRPLDRVNIDAAVTRKEPGAYALGPVAIGRITVLYVGRAESDLAERLKQHIGIYSHFTWIYASSPKRAFEIECEMYHTWMPADNHAHPTRLSETRWTCPVCGE
ncbi:MAG TPA: hypothetical protein VKY65_07535 [Alphaproteobacteria bacterium]|nr:hypothetical protein [Alphaproteobacteria bacterium]